MDTISNRLTKISQNNSEIFTKKFVEEYTRNSFGSLSSKEVAILVFKLLREIGVIKEDDTHYTISRLLKIPQTRIKLLSLESQLRDPKLDEKYILNKLVHLLGESKIIVKNKIISLGIEDYFIKEYIENRLKKIGETPDYSHNKEILKISIEGFSQILDDLMDDNNKQSILKKIHKDKSLNSFVKATFKETLVNILGTALAETAKQVFLRLLIS